MINRILRRTFCYIDIQKLNLNRRLVEVIKSNNIDYVSKYQKDIFDTIKANQSSLIRSTCGLGKSFISSIYILNMIMNANHPPKLKDYEMFTNPYHIYINNKKIFNSNKILLPAKGALIISPNLNKVLTQYKTLRLLDPKNSVKIVRFGTPLQTVIPLAGE